MSLNAGRISRNQQTLPPEAPLRKHYPPRAFYLKILRQCLEDPLL